MMFENAAPVHNDVGKKEKGISECYICLATFDRDSLIWNYDNCLVHTNGKMNCRPTGLCFVCPHCHLEHPDDVMIKYEKAGFHYIENSNSEDSNSDKDVQEQLKN